MLFDHEKARQLDCEPCTQQLQLLRNCNGTGRPARIPLNDTLYSRCPRAIYLESLDARFYVKLYMECRKTNTYPSAGPMNKQTAFLADLFEHLDDLFAAQKMKIIEKNKPK